MSNTFVMTSSGRLNAMKLLETTRESVVPELVFGVSPKSAVPSNMSSSFALCYKLCLARTTSGLLTECII